MIQFTVMKKRELYSGVVVQVVLHLLCCYQTCIYDNAPATMQTTGELTINVYDIVLLAGGTHMAFVTGIDNENGTITVAEANYNGAVRWGGTYKISDICGVITRQ